MKPPPLSSSRALTSLAREKTLLPFRTRSPVLPTPSTWQPLICFPFNLYYLWFISLQLSGKTPQEERNYQKKAPKEGRKTKPMLGKVKSSQMTKPRRTFLTASEMKPALPLKWKVSAPVLKVAVALSTQVLFIFLWTKPSSVAMLKEKRPTAGSFCKWHWHKDQSKC